jgi:hypothetical protein
MRLRTEFHADGNLDRIHATIIDEIINGRMHGAI